MVGCLRAMVLFLRIRKGHFVARTLDTESLERAYTIKRQGDHHWNFNRQEKAVAKYREALSADTSLPEAHAALGRFYYQEAKQQDLLIPLEALAAYERAWQHHRNFHYANEQIEFYRTYMEALNYAYTQQLSSSDGNLPLNSN